MGRCIVTGKIMEVQINRDEIIWAAGFYDGEGCCTVCIDKRKGHNPTFKIQVTQKDLRPLLRFKKAVLGLGKLYTNKKGISEMSCNNFRDTQAVIALLWKFLTGPKKEQYKINLKLYKELYDPQLEINFKRERSERFSRMNEERNRLRRVK